MRPVRTNRSNFVYRGPAPGIGDAWCERNIADRAVYLVWTPSEAEADYMKEHYAPVAQHTNFRSMLLKMGIFGMEPIPPVSLNIADANGEWLLTALEPARDKPADFVPENREFPFRHTREYGQLLNAVERAVNIIESADRRAEAVDGPVNHVRDELTDQEWRELYQVLKRARGHALLA